MKPQQPSFHQSPRQGTNVFSRFYSHPTSFFALLFVSYALLLAASYNLGYLRGSSFSGRDISTFVISRTALNTQLGFTRLSEVARRQIGTQCADPVPPELVRQTLIDVVYNGKSPYDDLISAGISSSLHPIKKWNPYETTYKSLIHRVRPKTIITFTNFTGASATYMANLTGQLSLNTQIICLDSFHGWAGSHDLFEDIAMPNGDGMLLSQFMQNVIYQNTTETILPIPLSTTMALEKFCEWGIFGDLIEVNAGRDFLSAWSDINRAYKLLRPGGILFGHHYYTSYYNKGVRQAVRLFAQVNKFRVKADGQHWMIASP